MLIRFRKIFILLIAAALGMLVYKVQRHLTAPGTAAEPGHNMYSSVTGPGSLMETWKKSTADRDRREAGNNEPVRTQSGNAGDDVLLLAAAAKGDKDAVEKALAAGVPADVRDSLRRTPLMYASWNGYDDIVTRLVAAGANPEFKDDDGHNAYDYAAGHGLVASLEFLLKRTRANDDHHYMEYAELINAAFAGDAAKLPEGKVPLASVNRINPEDVAPLYIVAGNGSLAMMEALIQRGANVNLANKLGQTALHWAAWNNQPQAIELLIEKGAKLEEADLGGNTPLILAAQNNSGDAVNMLLAKGADRYAANLQGKTAAILAEDAGYTGLARVLK